ncbi:hypothetical protein [Bdellovibrio sp. HCB337]|uniref:hypothetical protein n=1 Tax=Bdellovibrio sp. HCB337 TaxID=3394358 RepID=UPI0039A5460B
MPGSSSSTSPVLVPRIYGFDLLRIVTVWAILYFHVWQFSFFQDQITLPPEISSYHLLVDFVGVLFKYGGLLIVALSFFLIGFKAKSYHIQRFVILIVGVIGLQILSSESPMDPQSWEWDVYSYLVFSYIFVAVLSQNKLLRQALVFLSLILLSIPFELYGSRVYPSDGALQFAGWNLLPWLALPVLFHSLGILWREKKPDAFIPLAKWEWPVWAGFILIFLVVTPDYGVFPAGPGFEAYVFQQKPLMFWKHFSIFMFLMRLSLDPRVNGFLGKIKIMEWISNLKWNRRLGFCYLLQFVFMPLGPLLMEFWGNYPRLFEWLWLFIFVAVELFARAVLNSPWFFKKAKFR